MCFSIVNVSIPKTVNGKNNRKTLFLFFKNLLNFYTGYIISNLFANSYNLCVKKAVCIVFEKNKTKHMLCHFLENNYNCVRVCILATQPATLASLFWHSIYCPVIWGFSFSLHPKFLCPCAAKISLCVRVNHLSYAHAPLRKGQGCHLIPAALRSYLCASYSRPLAEPQLGYPSTLFIPIAQTVWA